MATAKTARRVFTTQRAAAIDRLDVRREIHRKQSVNDSRAIVASGQKAACNRFRVSGRCSRRAAYWGRYIRDSGKDLRWSKRDDVHANERGMQILGQLLAGHFIPPVGAK